MSASTDPEVALAAEAPPPTEAPKRRRRKAPDDALPAVVPESGGPPAAPNDVLAAARAEIELEQRLHALVEEMVLRILTAGEDYGISHARNCTEQAKPAPFQGPGRCPSCRRKPDLWLPSAEKIAKRLGFTYGEASVADDIMRAAHLEVPWVAFRVALIRKRDGEVIGHGIGARTLAQSSGDPNTMMKMAKKSAIIDCAKTNFALSGFFSQDGAAVDRDDVPAGAAPTTPQAPPPPPPPAPALAPPPAGGPMDELRRIAEQCAMTAEDKQRLYRIAGWVDGEALNDERQHVLRTTVLARLRTDFKTWIDAHGGWVTEPAKVRDALLRPWLDAIDPPKPPPAASPTAPLVIPDRATPSLDTFVAFYALDADVLQRLYACAGWVAGAPPTTAHARTAHDLCEKTLSAWIQAHGGWPAEAAQWTAEDRRRHVFEPWLQGLEQFYQQNPNQRPTGA